MQALFYIDGERARAFLPDGYQPTDGGNLIGLKPAGTGTGQVALNVMGFDCLDLDVVGGRAAWFFAAIDIEPPLVGNETSPSEHDLYDVLQVTGHDSHKRLLERAGLPVHAADVLQEASLTGPAATGTLTARDENGRLLRIEVAANRVFDSVEPSAAEWHQNQAGVTLTDLDGQPGAQVHLGSVTTCAVRAGSVLADLLGTTDCAAGAALGAVATGYAVEGAIHFLPGAEAEVAD